MGRYIIKREKGSSGLPSNGEERTAPEVASSEVIRVERVHRGVKRMAVVWGSRGLGSRRGCGSLRQ